MKKIIIVAGARPNFMKVAPLVRELRQNGRGMEFKLVHTGQHYDYQMSEVFFEELKIAKPDYFLGAGSGSHAEQTAKIMVEFEKIILKEKPDSVVVVGDVNSTLACSVTAKKMGVKVAHIEAGLRSGDMAMPEEINRLATDSISDFLFVTEKSALENLKKEGKPSNVHSDALPGKPDSAVFLVGNIMIDSLIFGLKKLEETGKTPDVAPGEEYAVLTLHRPSNVDDSEKLKGILEAVLEISRNLKIYFPIHPRTEKNLEIFRLKNLFENANIKIMPPLSYFDFLALWKGAELVLTDSGGIQEEAMYLNKPCLTIRDNTERPITVEQGSNILAGTSKENILKAYEEFKKSPKSGSLPELWDGKTAGRILDILAKVV
jgi:UDP-N-acetylglucosamine 2-epimerase (non-hydrolysing)